MDFIAIAKMNRYDVITISRLEPRLLYLNIRYKGNLIDHPAELFDGKLFVLRSAEIVFH